MATVSVQAPAAEPAPALPDYVLNPNAVLEDREAEWRYGRAPDYSKTRKFYLESECSVLPQHSFNAFDLARVFLPSSSLHLGGREEFATWNARVQEQSCATNADNAAR